MRERSDIAATHLQRVQRGRLARARVLELRDLRRSAAATLQSVYRIYRHSTRREQAATVIQCVQRGRIARGHAGLIIVPAHANVCAVLSRDPLVLVIDGVLGAEESAALLDCAKASGSRSSGVSVAPGDTSSVPMSPRLSDGRISRTCLWTPQLRALVACLCERVAALLGVPPAHLEPMVLQYEKGGEYQWHWDAYDLSTPRGRVNTASRGQRLYTAIAYLNAVEAGGATAFEHLGISVIPKPGRVLLFRNVHPGTVRVHRRTLHAVRDSTQACSSALAPSPLHRQLMCTATCGMLCACASAPIVLHVCMCIAGSTGGGRPEVDRLSILPRASAAISIVGSRAAR